MPHAQKAAWRKAGFTGARPVLSRRESSGHGTPQPRFSISWNDLKTSKHMGVCLLKASGGRGADLHALGEAALQRIV